MNHIEAQPTEEFGDIHRELRRHRLSAIIEKIYSLSGAYKRRSIASILLKLIFKLEGGPYYSFTARKWMKRDYDVSINVHSYGEAFVPGAFSPSVVIGKYVSIGRGVRVFTQNHPTDTFSTHPYFYEKQFDYIQEDVLEPATTIIENDVWIGQGAIILPGCKRIGNGAIIGAGAVVTKDVDDYAIVGGNPAKLLKYRLNSEQITELLNEKWWDKDKAFLVNKFSNSGHLAIKSTLKNS